MRIALLISGNVGTFELVNLKTSPSIEWNKITKKYNIDVFAYTTTNDFYVFDEDIQYFSDEEKKIIVTNGDKRRIYKNTSFINNQDAYDKINVDKKFW